MKVAIDCRYLGHSETGRMLEGILSNLDFTRHQYVLIGKKELIERYPNCYYVYDNTDPTKLSLLYKVDIRTINKCDVFFTPHFVVPFGIKAKVISMIPNLMWLDHPELNKGKIDTRHKKRRLARALNKSIVVYTPTLWAKTRIKTYFGEKYYPRIKIIKPGVSKGFLDRFNNNRKKGYVMYTSNFKKMSGIDTLLNAIKDLPNLELKILGRRSKFLEERPELSDLIMYPNVSFTEKITNSEMLTYIQQAKFLVVPSIYQGFSQATLEAINLGTKPIISDIEPYKELYSDTPVEFFKVGDVKDLCDKLVVTSPTVSLPEGFNEEFDAKNLADSIVETIDSLDTK